MSDADRESASGEHRPAPVPPRRDGVSPRTLLAAVGVLAGLAGFALVFQGHDAFHIAGGLFAIAVGAVALSALWHGGLARRERFSCATLLVAAFTYLVWAILPQHDTAPPSKA